MELVSRRELAKRTNLSETSIRDYIKAGKITVKSFASGIHGQGDLIYEIAFTELVKFRPSLISGGLGTRESVTSKTHASNSQELKEINPDNDDDISYAEAERREKIAKAQIAELTLLEKQGMLVSVDEVRKSLFTYGAEIRTSILSIPDRTIDNILACDNRSEALLMLQNELVKALTALTDIKGRNLTGR